MYIEAVMAETDCFCVADDHGHKVCEPAHCDAGREQVTKLRCSLYSVCFTNLFLSSYTRCKTNSLTNKMTASVLGTQGEMRSVNQLAVSDGAFSCSDEHIDLLAGTILLVSLPWNSKLNSSF